MGNGDEAGPGDEAPAQAQSGTYDQAFFLSLAARGKDAWNAWRRDPANKDVYVTFKAIAHAPFEGVKMGRCLGLYFFGCGDIANISQPSGDTAA